MRIPRATPGASGTAALALIVLALVACHGARTEVVVTVTTAGLAVPDDVDTVTLVVTDEEAGVVTWPVTAPATPIPLCTGAVTADCMQLPIVLTLRPGPQRPMDHTRVEVTALRHGAAVIADVALFQFVSGQSQEIDFVLGRDCLGRTDCAHDSATGACGAGGHCVALVPTVLTADPILDGGPATIDGGVADLASSDDATDPARPDLTADAARDLTEPPRDLVTTDRPADLLVLTTADGPIAPRDLASDGPAVMLTDGPLAPLDLGSDGPVFPVDLSVPSDRGLDADAGAAGAAVDIAVPVGDLTVIPDMTALPDGAVCFPGQAPCCTPQSAAALTATYPASLPPWLDAQYPQLAYIPAGSQTISIVTASYCQHSPGCPARITQRGAAYNPVDRSLVAHVDGTVTIDVNTQFIGSCTTVVSFSDAIYRAQLGAGPAAGGGSDAPVVIGDQVLQLNLTSDGGCSTLSSLFSAYFNAAIESFAQNIIRQQAAATLAGFVAACPCGTTCAPPDMGAPDLSVPGRTVFGYTGADQTWSVPVNCATATFYAWGAGGGANCGTCGLCGEGGGGGFVQGGVDVTQGQSFTIVVGGPGIAGDRINAVSGGYGGGGGSTNLGGAGSGGGRSAVQQGGVELLTAGGGGGAGSSCGSSVDGGAPGGAGGGDVGQAGALATGGGGGSQSAGGADPSDPSGNGQPFLGGVADGRLGELGGGGGGGGYFGGGAAYPGGGGGGSSYYGTTGYGGTVPGNFADPGNGTSVDNSGLAGRGGAVIATPSVQGTNGQPGLVVAYCSAPATGCKGFTDCRTGCGADRSCTDTCPVTERGRVLYDFAYGCIHDQVCPADCAVLDSTRCQTCVAAALQPGGACDAPITTCSADP